MTSTTAAAIMLLAVTSLASAQANSAPQAGARSAPPAARSDLPLPADSILVRPLAFRSIGPAVMSGRIADLAVTDEKTFASIIEQAKGGLEKKSKSKKAA